MLAYSGQLEIQVSFQAGSWRGEIRSLETGENLWAFEGVIGAPGPLEAAEAAISFGSYYGTGNRGAEVPEWAPPPEIADEIGNLASYAPEGLAGEILLDENGAIVEDSDGPVFETVFETFAVFESPEAEALFWGAREAS